jgi:hypothetical protein
MACRHGTHTTDAMARHNTCKISLWECLTRLHTDLLCALGNAAAAADDKNHDDSYAQYSDYKFPGRWKHDVFELSEWYHGVPAALESTSAYQEYETQ